MEAYRRQVSVFYGVSAQSSGLIVDAMCGIGSNSFRIETSVAMD